MRGDYDVAVFQAFKEVATPEQSLMASATSATSIAGFRFGLGFGL
jgi:hypothetical protein